MNILVGPLVRAISPTQVTIWVEVSQSALVTLQAQSIPHQESIYTYTAPTISIGGHFYAAPQLPSLLAHTWYTYKLIITAQDNQLPKSTISSDSYCFKTLAPDQGISADRITVTERGTSPTTLRIAYGSCRKLSLPEEDTLSAYGDWLLEHKAERETLWPQILLLIGDQIYADEPPFLFRETFQNSKTNNFEEFAQLYRYVWTNTPGIRQLLANIPTYMIFDDHEITNNWNLFSGWRANALRQGQEHVLVDGMVAYWIYQGWGNLLPDEETRHPLLTIMQKAMLTGQDVLEALRACIRDEVYGRTVIPWHYIIPTAPPIFVSNVRAERSAVFSSNEDDLCTSTRIMSSVQMLSLKKWLHTQPHQPALLVSSVPVLLPPLIGLVEYMMGIRPLQKSPVTLLRKLGLRVARWQLRLAIGTSFDHWPVFSDTWQELRQMLLERPSDILVLSGDVHFSYAATARPLQDKQAFRLYQFVCSPLENELGKKSQRQILLQSYLPRSIYGGLSTRMLPLRKLAPQASLTRRHLFQRAIAEVTLTPGDQGRYSVHQEYRGYAAGKFQVIASTTV